MRERLTKWFKNVHVACIARTQLHGQILFEAYNLESDDAGDVQEALDRLAAYEDTGLTPERAAELAAADKEGRLVVLPCKGGGKMFSFCWNIKSEKYEIRSSEIKNVRYDSIDGSVMVSDGERFHVWGKTAFLTRAEAEAALAAQNVGGDA